MDPGRPALKKKKKKINIIFRNYRLIICKKDYIIITILAKLNHAVQRERAAVISI